MVGVGRVAILTVLVFVAMEGVRATWCADGYDYANGGCVACPASVIRPLSVSFLGSVSFRC